MANEENPPIYVDVATSSFENFIILNDEGDPTLDISKLKYKPKKKKPEEVEKVSWYIPDYFFIIFNFLSLTYSTFFFVQGWTLISWRNTMQMLMITKEECGGDLDESDNVAICKSFEDNYGKGDIDLMMPFTIIRFAFITDPSLYGVMLFVIGLFGYVNIMVGINACLDGSQGSLASHLMIDGILILIEAVIIAVFLMSGKCDKRDIEVVRAFLERHVTNYAKDVDDNLVKMDTIELDLIQRSLGCCGVSNWTDFMPKASWTAGEGGMESGNATGSRRKRQSEDETGGAPGPSAPPASPAISGNSTGNSSGQMITEAEIVRQNMDNSDLIIPSSCCRQWWARNLYCATNIQTKSVPTASSLEAHQFRERISQFGCLPKIVGLCDNLLTLCTITGLAAVILHLILFIFKLIFGIYQLIRNNRLKKEMNQSEDVKAKASNPMLQGLFDLEDDYVADLPPPPNEKDMHSFQSRKAFNRVQSAMTRTHFIDWINQGRSFVEQKDIGRPTDGEFKRPGTTKPSTYVFAYPLEKKKIFTDIFNQATAVESIKDVVDAAEALRLLKDFK